MARKNETPEEKAYRNMFQAATKAPDINVNILIPEARAAVSDYLSAVFHQHPHTDGCQEICEALMDEFTL